MKEEKQKEFQEELKTLTKELSKLNHEADKLQFMIDKTDEVEENDRLKELCSRQMVLQNIIATKEARRNHLINLFNIIPN